MKASLNRASLVVCTRPETRRSNHGQDELNLTVEEGPHRCELQVARRNCG